MKHTLNITFLIILLFLLTQFIGLAIIDNYIDVKESEKVSEEKGEPMIVYKDLPYKIERPKVEESKSYIPIMAAIIIGSVLFIMLSKVKRFPIWKIWFFLAVLLCLSISFSAFIPSNAAFIIALVLTYLKINKPNIYTHNLSELFIYGGLAAIIVPIMNLQAVIILLIAVSIYDVIAVFYTKHMIKMAKFQSKANLFAGLFLPYKTKKDKKKRSKKMNIAILGGGDMAFPLIFAGVAMKSFGLLKTNIIPLFAASGLILLFLMAKKKKFYPAMPFVTAGCLVGYFILTLI